MNKQNKVEINENASKRSIKNIMDKGYTYTLDDIKKILLLNNIPKFLSIFGLSGFCVSVVYLLLCPFCCPQRWIVALFQIILFGAIYYIGDKNAIS